MGKIKIFIPDSLAGKMWKFGDGIVFFNRSLETDFVLTGLDSLDATFLIQGHVQAPFIPASKPGAWVSGSIREPGGKWVEGISWED